MMGLLFPDFLGTENILEKNRGCGTFISLMNLCSAHGSMKGSRTRTWLWLVRASGGGTKERGALRENSESGLGS